MKSDFLSCFVQQYGPRPSRKDLPALRQAAKEAQARADAARALAVSAEQWDDRKTAALRAWMAKP